MRPVKSAKTNFAKVSYVVVNRSHDLVGHIVTALHRSVSVRLAELEVPLAFDL